MKSEIMQFCLANVSRNDRMAKSLHEPSLKARYAESADHWRRLAEQIKAAYPSLPALVHHRVEHRDADHKQDARPERLQIENLETAHDRTVNTVTEIEARRHPSTGEWDASFDLSGFSTELALIGRNLNDPPHAAHGN